MNYVSRPVWSNQTTTFDLKLIKVKTALNVSEDEAKQLIDQIDSNQELSLSDKQLSQLMVYGLRFDVRESHTDRLFRQQREREQAEQKRNWEEMEKKAEEWFATLSPQEQELVKFYGYKHCQLTVS